MAIAVLGAGVVLQLVAVGVDDAGDLEEQRVVGTVRAGILDGNVAIDAVKFADEDHVDVLVDGGHPVGRDVHVRFEAGDVPVARGGGEGEGREAGER